MKKILTVIGARPQIIKAAAISRELRQNYADTLSEAIVHTGQHYDDAMSEVFFREMGIPQPHFRLEVGSGNHGAQTAAMLQGIEKILTEEACDALLVYGDTNSTLAGALAASKLHIPVIHVEAGLRSFNKSMPEELNRIMCDHASTLLFCPTHTAVQNLANEGFVITPPPKTTVDRPAVYHCGDVMFDNTLFFSAMAVDRFADSPISGTEKAFVLATIHRPYNTDDPQRLVSLVEDLLWLTEEGYNVVFPIHPRTLKALQTFASALHARIEENERFYLIPPASFLEMIYLEQQASLIVTDSGGVQKEAYFLRKPSVVVRTETEWVELVEHGSAVLSFEAGAPMREAFKKQLSLKDMEFPPIFGDGKAASFICSKIAELL
jgi:UDP-GlcNAc3NAcA epimerase